MSGALIQLVSRGAQDVYLNSDDGHSFFRMKFTRHTNFSQAPKFIKTITDKDPVFTIPVLLYILCTLNFFAIIISFLIYPFYSVHQQKCIAHPNQKRMRLAKL